MAFSRPARRGWAAIAVLLAWAGSLGWLGLRQYGHSDSEELTDAASLRLAPGDAWLSIMVGNVQVGTAGITLDTLPPQFRILESTTLELPQDTGLVHSARFTKILVGPTLSVQELGTSWSRRGRRTSQEISIEGNALVSHYPPGAEPVSFQTSDSTPTLLHIFPYQLALAKGMTKGRNLKVLMAEGWPASARMTPIHLRGDTTVTYPDSTVVDQKTGKWQTITTFSAKGVVMAVDGISGPYFVTTDARGRIQGLETLLGVRWVRENFDLAMNAFRQSIAGHVQLIRDAYPTVRAYAGVKQVPDSNIERRYIVGHRDGSPISHELLRMLAGGRQRVVGDTLIILPAGVAQPQEDREIGTDQIGIDPLIPWFTHTENLRDPDGRVTVEGLIKYVSRLVSVDTSMNAADGGVQALNSKHARPDGLARVFVGFARGSHLTARYVIGVRPEGDVLETHAWAEVRNSGGEWIAVDPVMGRAAASTSLIRLGWGGSSYPEDMLPMIANAKFTPVPAGMVK